MRGELERSKEPRLAELASSAGEYLPRIRGREAKGVAGYLRGLLGCWERLEAMQESETEKALCRIQQARIKSKIIVWETADGE